MINFDFTNRIPSKECEEEKRRVKDDRLAEDLKCSRKDSTCLEKSLGHAGTTEMEMEKEGYEPQGNLQVKRRLVVTRLTSEEHRSSQGCKESGNLMIDIL